MFDAYRLSGVGAHGSLLAPAYHCRTMLDPAISLGASIGLYPLDEALAPDLASLRQLVRGGPQPVRALLLTHFFGFAQAAAPIRALCDEHGIALIEDCSHALFDPRGGGESQSFGVNRNLLVDGEAIDPLSQTSTLSSSYVGIEPAP